MLSEDGRARPVDIGTGISMYGSKYSLPSAVFLDGTGLLVGQAAMNSRIRNPQNFISEFKRYLGEEVPLYLGSMGYLPEDFYTQIFEHMKRRVSEKSGAETIDKAFVTCPASYGEKKRKKVADAARAAGLFNVELVDEPTSAAMYYDAQGLLGENENLLVYDFGGGTFDVSLIRHEGGTFSLLAEPMGLPQCGGADIDRLIYADMLQSVQAAAPDVMEQMRAREDYYMRFQCTLAELAVKAKQHLSAAENFADVIQAGFNTIPYSLSRKKLNEMIAEMVGNTISLCRTIMERSGLKTKDLSAVLLVGGSSRIPLVRERVAQFAGADKVREAQNLELAVAAGALEYSIRQPGPKPGEVEAGSGAEVSGKGETKPETGEASGEGKTNPATGEASGEGEAEPGTGEVSGEGETKPETGEASGEGETDPATGEVSGEGEADPATGEASGEGETKPEAGKVSGERRTKPGTGEIPGGKQTGPGKDGSQDKTKKEDGSEDRGAAGGAKKGDDTPNGTGAADDESGNAAIAAKMYILGQEAKDPAEAFRWYTQSAELGYCDAQKMLALCLEKGKGCQADPVHALIWYEAAAKQGDMHAQLRAASIYREGENGIPKDNKKAFRWDLAAAKQGDVSSCYRAGIAYDTGSGTDVNKNRAAYWYKEAAKQDNARAMYALSSFYRKGEGGLEKDPEAAFSLLKKAAQQGLSGAQYDLGAALENGEGCERDISQAAYWYAMAAAQEHRNACYALGCLYRSGSGVEQDEEKACRLFVKAAALGHGNAAAMAAYCLENGCGTGRDLAGARKWYTQAAGQGILAAQKKLAQFCAEGRGGEKDEPLAAKWYAKAAAQGDMECILELARRARTGTGTKQDWKSAAQLYMKAAQAGRGNAQFWTGYCFHYGKGFERNTQKAMEWYRKAAQQEIPEAWFELGQCLGQTWYQEEGRLQEALEWYEKAAATGNTAAMLKAGDCCANCTIGDFAQAKSWYQKAKEAGNPLADARLKNLSENAAALEFTQAAKAKGLNALLAAKAREYIKKNPPPLPSSGMNSSNPNVQKPTARLLKTLKIADNEEIYFWSDSTQLPIVTGYGKCGYAAAESGLHCAPIRGGMFIKNWEAFLKENLGTMGSSVRLNNAPVCNNTKMLSYYTALQQELRKL